MTHSSPHSPDLTLEPLDVERDAGLLHRWVTHPKARFWMMQEASPAEVAAEYTRIAKHPHHHAWLGRHRGEPAFLAETYDPARSELAGLTALPDLEPGDLGMHVLVAPTDEPVRGFTRQVFAAVLEHCFRDPAVRRVVVEPDAANLAIRRLNTEHGFREVREVPLPGKTAMLSVLTRAAWQHATGEVAHLRPDHLEAGQRHLLTKALAELSHERLLEPQRLGDGRWRVTAPDGRTRYDFRARVLPLEHWVIEPASVMRTRNGEPAPLDVQAFVAEHAEVLGLPTELLHTYLEELAGTLAGFAWKRHHHRATATDLVDADYQELEAAMTEGHPSFLANNGRIGLGVRDHAAYAPETGSTVRLVWLAARRASAHLSLGDGLTEEALLAGELDPEVRAGFDERLTTLGLDPADYLLLPVHPWQWENKAAVTFAPDLARRDLVHLGEGPDSYQPQQSIRTFFNRSRPDRHYVKTALAVQNMGFVRGLSPGFMVDTPAINDHVAALVASDPTLQACGFSVLRERAAVGYTGDAYHANPRTDDRSTPHQKMLAALWRESPLPRLGRGERLATMASLLHRDAEGRSLAAAMVTASRLTAQAWLRSYLHAYVRPIVHCLVAHDLAFMPHGENLVLVLRDHVPVRALMKDIGEEVAFLHDRPLPPAVERTRAEVDDDERALPLQTDVMVGVLRHLAGILDDEGVLPASELWAEVRRCVRQHADEHPDLALEHKRYDFSRPTFKHSCVNRLQLRDTRQMLDLSGDGDQMMYAGELDNPLATAG
ncbi:GNAT family N-acetyltransferase [Nocardioides nanhaiensis]|uniref:Lysine N-acyltransferase MbtK n=1 Tax=Nocardioides nanhaiensis TaxID=1476871 RepID=A0ABP8W478_9ACTN